MGSCVSILAVLVRVWASLNTCRPRDIEEHDRLAAEDKAKLVGVL